MCVVLDDIDKFMGLNERCKVYQASFQQEEVLKIHPIPFLLLLREKTEKTWLFNYCVKTVVIDKKKQWTWTLKWIIIFVLLTIPLVMFIIIYRIEKITYQITNIFLPYKYLLPWNQYLFLSQEAKYSTPSLWILSLICNWLMFSEVEGLIGFFFPIGKLCYCFFFKNQTRG